MSKVITDEINGLSKGDIVDLPVGKGDSVYIHHLYDKSYAEQNVITPTDIIALGPIVDPRGYGTTYGSTTLANAIIGIGGESRTMIIPPGVWSITGTLTFPSTICVWVPKGALFSVPLGASLTFTGPVIAGNYQIFTGSGEVNISSSTPLRYSSWDGTTGDTVSFASFPELPAESPTSNYQAAHKAYVDASGSSPTGVIAAFGGATPPVGWLICNGTAISRTTYAALFSAIGTNFGVGDGSTTFNIPNLRGRVIVGYQSTNPNFSAIGQTGGEETHLLTTEEIPMVVVYSAGYFSPGYGAHIFGAGDPHNNLQPYMALNYIIKY